MTDDHPTKPGELGVEVGTIPTEILLPQTPARGIAPVICWQIGAGDGARDYSDVFLRFGIILVGDGSTGEYKPGHPEMQYLMPFAENLKIGDRVVLRRGYGVGTWEIVAVGQVTSEYLFRDLFEDVEGWDLRHSRNMLWKTPRTNKITAGFSRGMFQRVNSLAALSDAEEIWNSGEPRDPIQIPDPPREVSQEELLDRLIEEGLSVNNSDLMATTISRLRRLAKWYKSRSTDVSEHEIRTFLVVPMLMALGWSEQKMKIEWTATAGRIDIAIFDKVYGKQSKPSIVVETKAMNDGLEGARKQVEKYADGVGCRTVIITDGIRYWMRIKNDEDKWEAFAYTNLLTFRAQHPYEPNVKGAIDLFLKLLPR